MPENKNNTRKSIEMFLDVYSQEQLEYLELLMETCSMTYPSKIDLLDLAMDKEFKKKVDSALPNDYVKAIQEVLPSFSTVNHVYNYNEPTTHGAMLNISEAIVKQMVSKLGKHNFKK